MDNSKEKKITINDIARLSGVSKASVSRYINGKYENLSEETRDRIGKIIEDTGYRPNRSAQRLKAGRTMLIGCVIGDISSPFSALLLRGIISECEKAGYQVLFANSDNDAKRERAAIQGFTENRVDGLIVNTSGGNDDYLVEINNRVPIVLADRGLMTKGVLDTVEGSNRESAKECIECLYKFGYEKVAFFTEGNRQITPRIQRCEGYLDGLREFYKSNTEPLIYEFDRHIEGDCAKALTKYILDNNGKRIAAMAVNGVTCQQMILAANEIGVSFGKDFGLCTFDDWDWLKMAPPGITSVKQQTEKIGEKSAKVLLEKVAAGVSADKSDVVDIILKSEIIIRGSTVK